MRETIKGFGVKITIDREEQVAAIVPGKDGRPDQLPSASSEARKKDYSVRRRDWPDIWYTATARIIDSYVVEYRLYKIFSTDPVELCGDNGHGGTVPKSLEDADVYAHGSVKWDGCGTWWVYEQDRGTMLHTCGRSGITDLGEAMARCWDWTRELCPKWDESIASSLKSERDSTA